MKLVPLLAILVVLAYQARALPAEVVEVVPLENNVGTGDLEASSDSPEDGNDLKGSETFGFGFYPGFYGGYGPYGRGFGGYTHSYGHGYRRVWGYGYGGYHHRHPIYPVWG